MGCRQRKVGPENQVCVCEGWEWVSREIMEEEVKERGEERTQGEEDATMTGDEPGACGWRRAPPANR